jgi:hypothetical protein
MRLTRPVRTRFRYGSPTRVNLATHHNSQAHSSKGTPSHHTPTKGDAGALTACRHMVSGTISQPLTGALFTFPSRYSSTIGHQGYLGLPRGRGRFTRNFTSFVLLGTTPRKTPGFRLPDSHRLRSAIPNQFDYPSVLSLPASPAEPAQNNPTTPQTQHLPTITRPRFSLLPFRSPLLRESHIVFYSSGY